MGAKEPGALRVLVVGENGEHAELMEKALGEELGATTFCCSCAGEVFARLRQQIPDVVVLDYHLADSDGAEAHHAIRSLVDVPVVVTGQGNESAAVEALKAGAEDYLREEGAYLRGLPGVVVRAVEKHRRRGEELTQLKKTSQALAGSLELEAVVGAALDGVMAVLRPDAAWLLLPGGGGALELVGARNLSSEATANPGAKFRSHASAAVPVKGEGRSGFLCAGANAANLFGPHDVELLDTIASHTASAVQNARLFASLSRAKREWERTFDSIADPIVISNDHFRVIRLNRAAAGCFNLSLREVPGRVCHRLLLGSERPCPWHDAVLRGVPVSSDRYLSHVQRWFSFSAFPFPDEEGRAAGVVHVLRDVTEERKRGQGAAQAQELAVVGELVGEGADATRSENL